MTFSLPWFIICRICGCIHLPSLSSLAIIVSFNLVLLSFNFLFTGKTHKEVSRLRPAEGSEKLGKSVTGQRGRPWVFCWKKGTSDLSSLSLNWSRLGRVYFNSPDTVMVTFIVNSEILALKVSFSFNSAPYIGILVLHKSLLLIKWRRELLFLASPPPPPPQLFCVVN